MRKSPSEHLVHEHSRSTSTGSKTRVRKYHRGEGKPETPQIFGRAKQDDTSHGGFDITIAYADGTRTKGVVKGDDYRQALPRGIGIAKQQVRSITLRKMEPWTREVKN